jgi:hypothetical protein
MPYIITGNQNGCQQPWTSFQPAPRFAYRPAPQPMPFQPSPFQPLPTLTQLFVAEFLRTAVTEFAKAGAQEMVKDLLAPRTRCSRRPRR